MAEVDPRRCRYLHLRYRPNRGRRAPLTRPELGPGSDSQVGRTPYLGWLASVPSTRGASEGRGAPWGGWGV